MAGTRTFVDFLKAALLFALVAVCLFGGSRALNPSGVFASLAREVQAICRDPGTQWLLFVCGCVYLGTFALLLRRRATKRRGEARKALPSLVASAPSPHPALSPPSEGAERVSCIAGRLACGLISNPVLWLMGVMIFAAFAYASDYAAAAQSTKALLLVFGAAIGMGFSIWVSWAGETGKGCQPVGPASCGEGAAATAHESAQKNSQRLGADKDEAPIFVRLQSLGRFLGSPSRRIGFILFTLVALLAAAAFWKADAPMTFRYRGTLRWSGPWDNPNEYGLLMGIGVVIACGVLVAGFRLQVAGWKAAALRWLTVVLCVVGLVMTGVGLFKSYSRGAWLATVCGLAYLVWNWVNRGIREIGEMENEITAHASDGLEADGAQCSVREASQKESTERRARSDAPYLGGRDRPSRFSCLSCLSWCHRNWLPLAIVLVSLFVVAFWQFRHTEFAPARRAFSAGNVNDFSWRNRVSAWEGSLQMMAEKPWLGWGWNQPEQVYDNFYRAARLDEGMAIQLNDYFTLGTTLGLLALACFVVFAWLSLMRSAQCGGRSLASSPISDFRFRISDLLPAVCRAGAIVLLVGFWFDGGLFKLHLATPFWILLSLGSLKVLPADSETAADEGNAVSLTVPPEVLSARGPMPAGSLHHVGGAAPFCGSLWIWAGLLALAFVTAMLWAKSRDPFRRLEFSLKSPDGKTRGMAVMPKAGSTFPVVVFLHGSGGDVLRSGSELRQFAELGLAAVDLEYNQTNQAACDHQLISLRSYLERQSWARTNAIAWVGFSLGAQRSLSFALRHPEAQPDLLVRVSGGWGEELNAATNQTPAQPLLRCPTVIVHGEHDQGFPLADARRLHEWLRASGTPTELHVLQGRTHGLDPDRALILRLIAEHCAKRFSPADAETTADGGRRQTQLRRENIRPLATNVRPANWHYGLPLVGLACLAGVFSLGRRGDVSSRSQRSSGVLRWVALALAVSATLLTALHLAGPRLQLSPRTAAFAARWLVRPALKEDFLWLAQQNTGADCSLGTLLTHVELAALQRNFFDKDISADTYRQWVLSPAIVGEVDLSHWRRPLWEAFYPRIRRESDPRSAAQSVVRFLRQRVMVSDLVTTQTIRAVWQSGVANPGDFERTYVAALRSVGIAARIGASQQTEILVGPSWEAVPRIALAGL